MQVNKETVLVGSDFEMFLTDKREGKIISSIPFIKGTKDKPEHLPKKGFMLQKDNVLTEVNVPPVDLNSGNEFWNNVKWVREHVENRFGKRYELTCCPTAEMDDSELQEDEAKQFGCDAAYNAWEDGNVIEREIPEGIKLRSAAAHLHFSYEGANIDTSMELMKVFDTFLAVPFVLIDKDKKRRQLYGKAGEFRLQNYGSVEGFEARTLSNVWVESEDLVEYVFNQLNSMFDHYNTNSIKEIEENRNDIIKCINESDEGLAEQICEKFGILFPIHAL